MTINFIESILNTKFPEIKILKKTQLFGGDINKAAHLKTTKGDFFIKWNGAQRFPKMFETEYKALQLLKKHSPTLQIPESILYGENNNTIFLILEFINTTTPKNDFWQKFAEGLASIHQQSNEFFGLNHNNYMGSLSQNNTQEYDFIEFFIQKRLEPQVKLAYDKKLLNKYNVKLFTQLYKTLINIVPREKPALIHGDLWNGNFMSNANGYACIYDPATYFGHRESDIAMSLLFGGFDKSFYTYYNEVFPLEKDWEKRIDIFNLYPLLIHANLFAASYVPSVINIIKRFAIS